MLSNQSRQSANQSPKGDEFGERNHYPGTFFLVTILTEATGQGFLIVAEHRIESQTSFMKLRF